VQAIPLLSLEVKRQQEIGKAYLNRDRCIAWAESRDCIVCEEMCPVADKAITLQPVNPGDPQADTGNVQQPHINRDLCIGCGICEYQCPVEGEAAIRVFSADSDPGQRFFRRTG
jgi:ferredoxin